MTPSQQAVEEALKLIDEAGLRYHVPNQRWAAGVVAAEVRRLRELLTLSEARIRRLESELHTALERVDDPDDIGFPRK